MSYEVKLYLFLFLIVLISGIRVHKFKFLERCEDMLTCDGCVNMNGNCGWCYSTGLCMSGNEIGPSVGTCEYRNWESSSCVRRQCKSYDNILACVTQRDCLWCKKSNDISEDMGAVCDSISNRNYIDCDETYTIENYAARPLDFRGKMTNNKELNQDLEKMSGPIESSSTTSVKPEFLENDKFLNKLRSWLKSHSKDQLTLYDSIDNPAGAFAYQINLPLSTNNKTLQPPAVTIPSNFTLNDYNQLSKLSQTNIVELSKILAVNILKSMFNFVGSLSLTSHYRGGRYYLLLEKIAGDRWDQLLTQNGVTKEELYKIMKLDKTEVMTFGTNKTEAEIINRYKKLSLIYPFKLDSNDLSSLKLTDNAWSKLPGANVTLKSYIGTTVIVFQKITLGGLGNNFNSIFFHNENEIKALSNVRNYKNLVKIDLTNFLAKKLDPGFHNFFLTYKTDFTIDANDKNNNIETNTLELPLMDNNIINKEGTAVFNSMLNNTGWFEFKDFTTQFRIQEKANNNFTSTNNHVIFYKISSNTLKKNLFCKLFLRNLDTDQDYQESSASHSLFIPSLGVAKNIAGIMFVSLEKGKVEVKLKGEFVLENSIDAEYLNSTVYSVDKYKTPQRLKKRQRFDSDSMIIEEINFLEEKMLQEIKKKKKKKKHIDPLDESSDNTPSSSKSTSTNITHSSNTSLTASLSNNTNITLSNNTNITLSINRDKTNNISSSHLTNIVNTSQTGISSNATSNPNLEKTSKGPSSTTASINTNTTSTTNTTNTNTSASLNVSIFTSSNKTIATDKSESANRTIIKNSNESLNTGINLTNSTISATNNTSVPINSNVSISQGINTTNISNTNISISKKANPDISTGASISTNTSINTSTLDTTSQLNTVHPQVKLTFSNETIPPKIANQTNSTLDTNPSVNSNPSIITNTPITNISTIDIQSSKETSSQPNTTPVQPISSGIIKDISVDEIRVPQKPDNATISYTPKLGEQKQKDFFDALNFNVNNSESLESIQKYFDQYDQVSTLPQNEISSVLENEAGELTIVQLPESALIYNLRYRGMFYYKGNSQWNEVPGLKKSIKVLTEKNVIISLKIILTLEHLSDFEFRLYANGKEVCDTFMASKNERIVTMSSISIEKYSPGEYNLEFLYLSTKDGVANMISNEWDVISMDILLLDF